ncbi:MAG: hypothetical protein JO257_33940 [Deltaproteobacteria bacterium]|nr:hypothetical protein [Deltaproteobacteria bacterium]
MRGIGVVIAFAVVACGERHAPVPKVDIPPGPPPVIDKPSAFSGGFQGKQVVRRKTVGSDGHFDEVTLYDDGIVAFSGPYCMLRRGVLPPERVAVLADALDRAGFFTYEPPATHCAHDAVVSLEATEGDKHKAMSFDGCKQPTPPAQAFADAVAVVVGNNPCTEPPPPKAPAPPAPPARTALVSKQSGGGIDGADRGSVFVYADGTVEWSGSPCAQHETKTTAIKPEKAIALQAAVRKLVESAPPPPERRGCMDCVTTFISVGDFQSIDAAAPGYRKAEDLLYGAVGTNPCRAAKH